MAQATPPRNGANIDKNMEGATKLAWAELSNLREGLSKAASTVKAAAVNATANHKDSEPDKNDFRTRLLNDLKNAVKTFTIKQQISPSQCAGDDGLRGALEQILLHGIRDPNPSLFNRRKPSAALLWQFLSQASSAEVNTAVITKVRNDSASDEISFAKRDREWMRIALADTQLLETVFSDKQSIEHYYAPQAFLMDPEKPDMALSLFRTAIIASGNNASSRASSPMPSSGAATPQLTEEYNENIDTVTNASIAAQVLAPEAVVSKKKKKTKNKKKKKVDLVDIVDVNDSDDATAKELMQAKAELIASLQGPDPPQEPTLTKEALESSPLSQTQYEVNMKANVGSDQPPVVMETTPDNGEETHGDTHTDSQTLERPKRMESVEEVLQTHAVLKETLDDRTERMRAIEEALSESLALTIENTAQIQSRVQSTEDTEAVESTDDLVPDSEKVFLEVMKELDQKELEMKQLEETNQNQGENPLTAPQTVSGEDPTTKKKWVMCAAPSNVVNESENQPASTTDDGVQVETTTTTEALLDTNSMVLSDENVSTTLPPQTTKSDMDHQHDENTSLPQSTLAPQFHDPIASTNDSQHTTPTRPEKNAKVPLPAELQDYSGPKQKSQSHWGPQSFLNKAGAVAKGTIQGSLNALEEGVGGVMNILRHNPTDEKEQNVSDSDDDFTLLEETAGEDGAVNIDYAENKSLQLLAKITISRPDIDFEKDQNCECANCGRKIPVTDPSNKTEFARRCEYDGMWYCHECHINEKASVPSAILHRGDPRLLPVSRQASQFLKLVDTEPIFTLGMLGSGNARELGSLVDANSSQRLRNLTQAMKQIEGVRLSLLNLKEKRLLCSRTDPTELRKLLWPREHLWNDTTLWTLQDLREIATPSIEGSHIPLEKQLRGLVTDLQKHLVNCSSCNNPMVRRF
eukprot:m.88750 g.88750  ORF g.88750 m.88750 type:complete len:921 (-) comp13186_c0_seq1:74-2836(-)